MDGFRTKIEDTPKFRTEDEEREFWAKHDVVDFFSSERSARGSFPALQSVPADRLAQERDWKRDGSKTDT